MAKFKLKITNIFKKQFDKLPLNIKKSLWSSLDKFVSDPFYPSLKTEKIKGTEIYSSRLNIQYHFSWVSGENKIIILRNVDIHDDLYNRP